MRAAPAGRGSARLSFWAIVPGMTEIPEQTLIALLRQRGLKFDEVRAAELRALAESLLGRLARIGERLPRDAEPPPPATDEDRAR
jgi:hypothetical protein